MDQIDPNEFNFETLIWTPTVKDRLMMHEMHWAIYDRFGEFGEKEYMTSYWLHNKLCEITGKGLQQIRPKVGALIQYTKYERCLSSVNKNCTKAGTWWINGNHYPVYCFRDGPIKDENFVLPEYLFSEPYSKNI